MTTADLYAAWITAGDHLQPVGAWISERWPYIAIPAIAATTLAWILRRSRGDRRARNDRRAALMHAHLQRPEPPRPGTNNDDLRTCLNILAATEQAEARKEKP